MTDHIDAARLLPDGSRQGVTQTILYDADLNEQGVYGNCLQAAVATVLDLPLDAVPHFSSFLWWTGAMELWARGRGLTTKTCTVADEGIPLFRAVLSGPSPRGVSHSDVSDERRNGEGGVVWDPHPSRDGLQEAVDVLWFEPWEHDDSACWACGAAPSLAATVVELQVENARLRDALTALDRELEDGDFYKDYEPLGDLRDLARAALAASVTGRRPRIIYRTKAPSR